MKKKKAKKSSINSREQLQLIAEKIKVIFAAHGAFIMFLLAGTSIGYALLKGKTYLDPARDEAKYSELTAKSFNKIDYTLVDKLSEALQDKNATVSQNKDPNRSNPFSE
jgi:hypothetical protein